MGTDPGMSRCSYATGSWCVHLYILNLAVYVQVVVRELCLPGTIYSWCIEVVCVAKWMCVGVWMCVSVCSGMCS